MDKNIEILKKEFSVEENFLKNTINLLDEGNTIPFIARYRKELTGSMTDEMLRDISDRLDYLKSLNERKAVVIRMIEDQDKMTEGLRKKIEDATTLNIVEDLYLPYKKKRRTRGTIAKENGLEELSIIILEGRKDKDLEEYAKDFIGEEVDSVEAALLGARDIIAEMVNEKSNIREYIRNYLKRAASISTTGKLEEETSIYKIYYDYEEKIRNIVPHRVLAINRGEAQKELMVKLVFDEEYILEKILELFLKEHSSVYKEQISLASSDGFKRLTLPSIEREIRNDLTLDAQEAAIKVFSSNLSQLLMTPPVSDKIILALDPAFRTGCKIAVIDASSNVVKTDVIYPVEPHNKIIESQNILGKLIKKYDIDIIVIGNGTASRETEKFVSDFLKNINPINNNEKKEVLYTIVNEAGASVYSASKLAREEFPEYDVSLRSAISIARRFKDGLSELVKIDPKSIGVGQYQHDLDQNRLSDVLAGVVESCVNSVGVDLNSASSSLLQYISGINKTIANNIVSYRNENGCFSSRKELLKVPRLGPKAFEQSAGFLRIKGGEEILDNTAVHPESYEVTNRLLDLLGIDNFTKEDFNSKISATKSLNQLSINLGIGILTLKDIVEELKKPGRDPREKMPEQILRSDVLDIDDLNIGMELKGTVRNIVDFGVFVDIGVHQDALVHISKLSDKFVKHPLDIVSVGDIIDVEVIDIDKGRNRISLKKL